MLHMSLIISVVGSKNMPFKRIVSFCNFRQSRRALN